LENLQQERLERINEAGKFPWRRLAVCFFLSCIALLLSGGGILSLILIILIISGTMRGSVKSISTRKK
jgi:hypothetical protein